MGHWSRRDFLKAGLAAGVLAGPGSRLVRAARRSATDWVTLGKSGVKVTRLAFGTGTFSGQTQRELGQDQFTRLVRHAYDRGIRFFETSETYGEMHKMLGPIIGSSLVTPSTHTSTHALALQAQYAGMTPPLLYTGPLIPPPPPHTL